MRDFNISAGQQKAEIKWLAGCFCIAFMLNIAAIIIYNTSWSEVFTQFLWVFIITFVLYAVTIVLRIILYLLRRLF
jgi:hypothetical protein